MLNFTVASRHQIVLMVASVFSSSGCWLSPSVPEPVQKAGGRGRDVILTRLWQKVSDKIGQVPSHGYAMFIPNLNNDYSLLCIDHSCVKSHHSEGGRA